MAVRPVFIPNDAVPFYSVVNIDFAWNGGFAVSQKRKNIDAVHNGFRLKNADGKPLEISSKSAVELGVKLSAFNLLKYVPELNKSIPVENVYQAGKVFADGTNFPDLMLVTPKEAKRDERLKQNGEITGFIFDNQKFPTTPQSLFYDYIYINALLENPELAEELVKYNGFTDIEYNPNKSISTQAKSAAIFVSLYKSGLTDEIKDAEKFKALFKTKF
ncbi:MAG: hypothetical protein K2N27_02270 [Ruminococcus sp.]|nr:hypothetical protein [Ruminococcus sp.]